MMRRFAFVLLALSLGLAPATAGEMRGQYLEARNCDVWTGPCFANADHHLTGKNAVMAWKIEAGSTENVSLEGLSVVAVVAAANTLGLEQVSPAKAILLVDRKANSQQREALVRFAQQQGGKLLANVVQVQDVDIDLNRCECDGQVCADLVAGPARVKTRCLNKLHDKACGNESAYYPPLAQSVQANPAAVVEHLFRGTGLNQNWSDYDRRGAYVGSFLVR